MSSYTFVSSGYTPLVRLIVPILLTVIVVLIGESAARTVGLEKRLAWGKTTPEYSLIYTRAVEAQRRGDKVIAFVGDSRVEWALSPETIQTYLESEGLENYEVFNLAYPGMNVRSIMQRLEEVGFFPDYLVVGYSHLSFYWSKLYLDDKPSHLSALTALKTQVQSFLKHKLVLAGYRPQEVLDYLRNGTEPVGGSWLSQVSISPRGMATVEYRIPEIEAVRLQQEFYRKMYETPMRPERFDEINTEFIAHVNRFRDEGTRVLLLRMPLAGWALELEIRHDTIPFQELARQLAAPAADANQMPDRQSVQTYDGLHVAPPSHEHVSIWVAKHLLMPVIAGHPVH